MIGMSFGSFLTLLVLGAIAAIVMYFFVRYRMLEGPDGFAAAWIAGWIGSWLGGPVLGHWWFQIQNIYIIPAFVGAVVGAFSIAALARLSRAAVVTTPKATTIGVPTEQLRKAS